jgi:hypothetical protein
MKIGFRGACHIETNQSVIQAFVVGDCLKVGSLCDDTDPTDKTDRAGKGITFCRTRKRVGRMTVSAPDLRRSNRLRWRRYANSDRTRLWIGRTSGHDSGLFVDGSPGRESPEANENIRHHYARRRQCGLSKLDWRVGEVRGKE